MRQLGLEHGFAPLTVDQIVQLGIHKIEPSYVLELLRTGAFNLNTPSDDEADFGQRRAKLKVKPQKNGLISQSDRLEAQLARAEAKRERELAKRERHGVVDERDDDLEMQEP